MYNQNRTNIQTHTQAKYIRFVLSFYNAFKYFFIRFFPQFTIMDAVKNKVEARLIIKPVDVAKIFGESYESARKRLKAVKDSLKRKHVTFSQFCKFEDLDYSEVCELCNISTIKNPKLS